MTHLIYPSTSEVNKYTKVEPMLLEAMGGNPYKCLILQYIMDWCRYNEAHPSAIKEGYAWFYHTEKEFLEYFRNAFSARSFQRYKAELIEEGWLITGCFNKKKYDKTTWYRPNWDRFADLQNQEAQKIYQKKENDKKKREKRSYPSRSAKMESKTSSCAAVSIQVEGTPVEGKPTPKFKEGITKAYRQVDGIHIATVKEGITKAYRQVDGIHIATVKGPIPIDQIIDQNKNIAASPSGRRDPVVSNKSIEKQKPTKAPPEKTGGSKIFEAYSKGIEQRYGVKPRPRDASVNSICKMIWERLGEESEGYIEFYLTISNNKWITDNGHSLKVALSHIDNLWIKYQKHLRRDEAGPHFHPF